MGDDQVGQRRTGIAGCIALTPAFALLDCRQARISVSHRRMDCRLNCRELREILQRIGGIGGLPGRMAGALQKSISANRKGG
jgi:hypothetical protein